jgi:uncharacterized membrane protein
MKSRYDTSDIRIDEKKSIANLLHGSFELGMILKGIDGVLEVLGGFLLMIVSPARLSKVVLFLTQHELSEDPKDILANFLLKARKGFSVNFQSFGIFYLLSHGVVKLFLVSMLLKKKLWAYPLTMVFLLLFIGYQIYRYTYSRSLWLVILTIFDIALIILTWMEYKRIKKVISIQKP